MQIAGRKRHDVRAHVVENVAQIAGCNWQCFSEVGACFIGRPLPYGSLPDGLNVGNDIVQCIVS
jgi:hypothetical protein